MPFNATDYLNQDTWDNLVQSSGGDTNSINSSVQQFIQTMQNLTGQTPSTEQINNFANQALMSAEYAPGNLGYSDAQSLVNNYVQGTYGPQVAKYQQQQQTSQLGNTQSLIQNMINKITGNTAKNLADPNSQAYQAFAGSMNNKGITPDSGAFQSGAGSTIASAGAGAIDTALQDVGLPAVNQIQGLSSLPLSFAGQNSSLSNLNDLQNFGLQASVAQRIADQSQPSAAMQDIGMASGAANALGGLGKAAGPLSTVTSYVCKELIKRDLICESDMDDFHYHIMPAMFKKGRAFWKYAMDGYKLVNAVNARGLDWKVFKPLLFDRVMEEPDPCKAVDLYADACHQLCISSDRYLWDKRVYRTSVFDSLLFFPSLFLYKPFREALSKCLWRKLSIVYDKPRCEVHR